MKLNTIYNEDCLETMARMPDGLVDLTVTSPPYDNIRKYQNGVGDSWNFEKFMPIADELYRVTKDGGVVVWVVGDATIKGSETGTSFRQALYFKEIGFNLHDTMIYEVAGTGAKGSKLCYWQTFDFMFVLSKRKIKTVNRIKDKPNKYAGSRTYKKKKYNTRTTKDEGFIIGDFGIRTNIWRYPAGNGKGDSTSHPAPFPEQLANDHIVSWSNKFDVVYDPFMGAGTTAKMALLNKRYFIGSELSEEYCQIANERIARLFRQYDLGTI